MQSGEGATRAGNRKMCAKIVFRFARLDWISTTRLYAVCTVFGSGRTTTSWLAPALVWSEGGITTPSESFIAVEEVPPVYMTTGMLLSLCMHTIPCSYRTDKGNLLRVRVV